MSSRIGDALTVVPGTVGNELPSEREYMHAIVECWQRIGYSAFTSPVESYPWGGRSHHVAWRIVVSNYIEPEDVLRAVWVRERAMREAPDAPGDWTSRNAGMCFMGDLLRERSDGRWQDEISELAAKLPTVLGYMDQEWGKEMRALLASKRRVQMRAVATSQDGPLGVPDAPERGQ